MGGKATGVVVRTLVPNSVAHKVCAPSSALTHISSWHTHTGQDAQFIVLVVGDFPQWSNLSMCRMHVILPKQCRLHQGAPQLPYRRLKLLISNNKETSCPLPSYWTPFVELGSQHLQKAQQGCLAFLTCSPPYLWWIKAHVETRDNTTYTSRYTTTIIERLSHINHDHIHLKIHNHDQMPLPTGIFSHTPDPLIIVALSITSNTPTAVRWPHPSLF